MDREISCVIVKPDGVGKSVVGKIIDRLEGEGFRLLATRMIRPTAEQMGNFYAEHKGKPFYEGLLKFITSGPIVVTAWEGNDVIKRVRALIGATNPKDATLGTFRAQWGTDNRLEFDPCVGFSGLRDPRNGFLLYTGRIGSLRSRALVPPGVRAAPARSRLNRDHLNLGVQHPLQ